MVDWLPLRLIRLLSTCGAQNTISFEGGLPKLILTPLYFKGVNISEKFAQVAYMGGVGGMYQKYCAFKGLAPFTYTVKLWKSFEHWPSSKSRSNQIFTNFIYP